MSAHRKFQGNRSASINIERLTALVSPKLILVQSPVRPSVPVAADWLREDSEIRP